MQHNNAQGAQGVQGAQDRQWMLAQYQAVIALAEKYQFEIAPLQAQQRSITSFRVMVPVIGTFNTGKSSMLNALMGYPLLASSVVAQTPAPTELTYGENALLVHRAQGVQTLGVGDMRTSYFETDGVLQMEMHFQSPALQEFSRLCLVDMPGLDSSAANHERTLRAYLPRSLGYILVFSAEEPVLKESVCNFLAELKLREIPVYILLTKCDKVTASERKQAILFFKRALKERLALSDVKIGCVQTRPTPQIDDLLVALREIQEMSDALCMRVYREKLQQQLQEMLPVLRLRMASQSASVQQLAQQSQALQAQMQAWEAVITRWQDDILALTERLEQNFMAEVSTRLHQMVPVFAAELSAKQDGSDKLNGALYYMMLALVKKELTDAFRQYLGGLQSEVTFHAAQDAGEDVFDLLSQFDRWNQEGYGMQDTQGATLVQACLGWMTGDGIRPILAQVRVSARDKKGTQSGEALVQQVLIPALLAEIEQGVRAGLASYASFVVGELRAAVAGRWGAMAQTLQSLIAEQTQQGDVQKSDIQQIGQDIAQLEQILAAVS